MTSFCEDQFLASFLSGQELEEAQLTFLQSTARPEPVPRKRKRGSPSIDSQELWNEGKVGPPKGPRP